MKALFKVGNLSQHGFSGLITLEKHRLTSKLCKPLLELISGTAQKRNFQKFYIRFALKLKQFGCKLNHGPSKPGAVCLVEETVSEVEENKIFKRETEGYAVVCHGWLQKSARVCSVHYTAIFKYRPY